MAEASAQQLGMINVQMSKKYNRTLVGNLNGLNAVTDNLQKFSIQERTAINQTMGDLDATDKIAVAGKKLADDELGSLGSSFSPTTKGMADRGYKFLTESASSSKKNYEWQLDQLASLDTRLKRLE